MWCVVCDLLHAAAGWSAFQMFYLIHSPLHSTSPSPSCSCFKVLPHWVRTKTVATLCLDSVSNCTLSWLCVWSKWNANKQSLLFSLCSQVYSTNSQCSQVVCSSTQAHQSKLTQTVLCSNYQQYGWGYVGSFE